MLGRENDGRLSTNTEGNQGETKILVDKTLVEWLSTTKGFYYMVFLSLKLQLWRHVFEIQIDAIDVLPSVTQAPH